MNRARIVLVEDNEDNQFLVEAILDDRADAYDLVCFQHPLAALEALAQPDVVPALFLFDISLPDMDGTGLLSAVRQMPHLAHVPAIALTAHAMQGDRERFLSHGFSDYVSKPIIDKQVLLDAIAKHLRCATPAA
jgi:CheY-like chemotaxis protein